MDSLTFSFFVQEFAKQAASVEQLQQATKRLGFLRVPRVKPTATMAKLEAGVGQHLLHPAEFASLGGGVVTIPSRKQVQAVIPGHMRQLEGLLSPEQIQEARETFEKTRAFSPVRPIRAQQAGGFSKNQGPFSDKMSGPGYKALNVAGILHEGFESAVKPGEVAMAHGHLSPDVLMKEHNMFSRMTGPGADEARGAMQGIRRSHGDASSLASAMEQTYGRPVIGTYGEGEKIPKAIRRDFRRRSAAGEVSWE